MWDFRKNRETQRPRGFTTLKKTSQIKSTMCTASRSAEPVGRTKYAAVIVVKSLVDTKGEEEKKRMQRKKMAIIT